MFEHGRRSVTVADPAHSFARLEPNLTQAPKTTAPNRTKPRNLNSLAKNKHKMYTIGLW